MREVRLESMSKWIRSYWKPIVLAVLVGTLCAVVAIFPVKEWIKELTYFLRSYGAVGILLFVVAYALATVGCMPGSIFTIAAGLIYGVLAGTAIALTGATIGATLAFLVSRYLFRNRVEKLLTRNKKLRAVDHAIALGGWKIIALVRLNPFIPFNLSNYVCGVTAIPFWPYLLASSVGMLPGAFLYAHLGALGQLGLERGKLSHNSWQWILLRLVLTVVATLVLGRISRSALEKAESEK